MDNAKQEGIKIDNNISRVILCILDGVGFSTKTYGNAWIAAKKPTLDALIQNCPHTLLRASGAAVGLPKGQMGNSEVGHMTIGAGRIISQDLLRINNAIKNGDLHNNPILVKLILTLKNNPNKDLHIMGLISDGGIHSHVKHVIEIIKILASHNIAKQIKIHIITDGRDTRPQNATKHIKQIINLCKKYKSKIATICGRYYAMDRDHREERTNLAYKAIALGASLEHFDDTEDSLLKLVEKNYKNGIYDEFFMPTTNNNQYHGMKDGDCLLSINFRADRIRQILNKLTSGYNFAMCIGMVEYSEALSEKMQTIFQTITPKNTIGEIIEQTGGTQLRIAETEKYAHITFFLNGGMEKPFQNETRILIPSPKVSTYDLKPEMSANEITEAVINSQKAERHTLICINYANADMVGHSGNLEASIKACETLDSCIQKLLDNLLDTRTIMIITADHGNVEEKYDTKTLQPRTQHTTNPVPFILITDHALKKKQRKSKQNHDQRKIKVTGGLSDVAPTILKILGIRQPEEMTGKPLKDLINKAQKHTNLLMAHKAIK